MTIEEQAALQNSAAYPRSEFTRSGEPSLTRNQRTPSWCVLAYAERMAFRLAPGKYYHESTVPAVTAETAATVGTEVAAFSAGRSNRVEAQTRSQMGRVFTDAFAHGRRLLPIQSLNIEKRQAQNVVRALELIRRKDPTAWLCAVQMNLEVMWLLTNLRIASPQQVRVEFEQAIHDET